MKRRLVGPIHDAAVVLHGAGWSDHRIGEALGFGTCTVRSWRKKWGILPVPRKSKIDHDLFVAMYNDGRTDVEIAAAFLVCQSHVTQWRNAHGMPAKHGAWAPLSEGVRRKGKALLRQGLSTGQVSEALGVCKQTVQRLRNDMKDKTGLRQSGHSVRADRLRVLAQDPELLMKRIRAAIPRGIARDIADDAASRMFLALLDGRFGLDEIEKSVGKYLNETFASDAPKFGTISLDDGEYGRALIETIEDEGAEAEVENGVWARNDEEPWNLTTS